MLTRFVTGDVRNATDTTSSDCDVFLELSGSGTRHYQAKTSPAQRKRSKMKEESWTAAFHNKTEVEAMLPPS